MENTKLALNTAKRNGVIKSYRVDKIPSGIFATAFYNDGEINLASMDGKYVVYEFLGNGKTAVYAKYDAKGKAISSLLKGTWAKGRRAKNVV